MKLNEVVPWGRSLSEYRRMFALTDADLHGQLLGCADGPASFNADATVLGHHVISCDPIYTFSGNEICRRVEACHGMVLEQARQNAHRFIWEEFPDPDALGHARLKVMRRFLADFETGRAQGRYVAGLLPHLPFANRQFDLCVCSHFLFLYAEQLDLAFHVSSMREMLRVANEVRIFPLLDLNGQPSPHIQRVIAAITGDGGSVSVRQVPYEFHRGGDRMMVVRGALQEDCRC